MGPRSGEDELDRDVRVRSDLQTEIILIPFVLSGLKELHALINAIQQFPMHHRRKSTRVVYTFPRRPALLHSLPLLPKGCI
ncbi:Telomere Length And Silencing Protein 1 [Manis pentadactyla]|nr:Telomere Length And Silencing Protein 1 [Manis pentadactyla]